MKYCADNRNLARQTSQSHIDQLIRKEPKNLPSRERLPFPCNWDLYDLFKIERRLNKYSPLLQWDEEGNIIEK